MGLERLKVIRKLNTEKPGFINRDLYRLLFSHELYVSAYENIKSNTGALTPAADPETLQGFSVDRIQNIINKMKDESWQPKNARLVMIPKPGKSTLRPLGIQGPDDKIVQEVVRLILNSIYECQFLKCSFGFRPNIGTHGALKEIDETFDGLLLAIEGDIKSCFPSICHQKLLEILAVKIDDPRFLGVIRKMLKAGYWIQHSGLIEKPLLGTPQGSIVSPLLSNIYLHELDVWIAKWHKDNISTDQPVLRRSPERKTLNAAIRRMERTNNQTPGTHPGSEFRKLKLEALKFPYYLDETRKKRLVYVRYADDFIIGLMASMETAQRLKQELSEFLMENLALTLSEEKTKITKLTEEPALFLGYNVQLSSNTRIKIIRIKGKTPFHKRTTGRFVKLKIPMQRVIERLYQRGYCDASGFPLSFKQYTAYDDADIVNHFNSVYRGIAGFYSGSEETNPKNRIRYILKFSCAKTLAHKHKTTINKIFEKHGPKLTIKSESINAKTSIVTERSISFTSASQIPQGWQVLRKHTDPFNIMLGKYSRTKLFSTCYICGSSDTINQHHIKSIKGIKPLTFDQLHGYINRKQIPLCRQHHEDVTHGRYDGIPLKELIERIETIRTEKGNGIIQKPTITTENKIYEKSTGTKTTGSNNKRNIQWQCSIDRENRSYTRRQK